jgi:hypothetical protein
MQRLPLSSPVRQRQAAAAAALLLPLVLHGCFTMGLWGFFPEEEPNPCTGEPERGFAYDEQTEWSWSKFGLRVLLTPLALALDCLTCPVQAVVFGCGDDDDEDDDGARAHRRR